MTFSIDIYWLFTDKKKQINTYVYLFVVFQIKNNSQCWKNTACTFRQ